MSESRNVSIYRDLIHGIRNNNLVRAQLWLGLYFIILANEMHMSRACASYFRISINFNVCIYDGRRLCGIYMRAQSNRRKPHNI